MKTNRCFVAVLLLRAVFLIATVAPQMCDAHDQPVHQAISQSAVLSSSGTAQFLNETVGGQNTNLVFNPPLFHYSGANGLTPIAWTTNGSYHEDDTPRFSDHFYKRGSPA